MFVLNIPIPCYIFIKQMSLFVVVLTRFMRTHVFFLFCRQCCRSSREGDMLVPPKTHSVVASPYMGRPRPFPI